MELTKDQKRNYVSVIGILSAIDRREGTTANGDPYVAGTFTVKAGDQEYKVEAFEMKTWGRGTNTERPNPKYSGLLELTNGESVDFSCSLVENRFFSQGQIYSSTRVSLAFINKPRAGAEPGLKFDIAGFVTQPIQEVRDKEDNLTHYSIKIGQAQYDLSRGVSAVELTVDPKNQSAVQYMRDNYTLHKTVRVSGHGVAKIVTEVIKEEAVFGDPIERVYQNYTAHFVIDSGSVVPAEDVYREDQIEALVRATRDRDEEMKSSASKPASSAASSGASSFADSSGGADTVGSLFGL